MNLETGIFNLECFIPVILRHIKKPQGVETPFLKNTDDDLCQRLNKTRARVMLFSCTTHTKKREFPFYVHNS